jgi:hypothetical protein
MDAQWAGGPDQTSTASDGMIQPWQPMSPLNQAAVPPCARCGAAYAAHLEGRCPTAGSWDKPPRRDWPTRHPWYTAAILLVALLGGIGVGTVSVSHTTYTIHSTGNAQACYAYWQLRDSAYSFEYPASTVEWYKLQAAAPRVTDPMLSNAIQAFNENLLSSDLADAVNFAADIEAVCNSLGYPDPA